jgi:ubiquinone/menaquinone biosynthesis C-methylase UbiE
VTAHEDLLVQARQFWNSRVILTATELDLFTRLHEEPADAEHLAAALDLDPQATTRLLDCLVTLGLLTKEKGRYAVAEAGAPLSSRHAESVRPMVLHYNHLWRNWSHLTESVRRGSNPHRIPATEEGGATLAAFIGAMHVVGREASREIARACDLGACDRLLDIGGGSGTYTIAFLERHPGLHAVLFDLPEVIKMAEARLQEAGLRERVTLVAGDFYRDELPPDCDAALLSAIIHQNSPAQNVALYEKIHRALRPGGRLIIRDHIMDEDRTHPPQGALFALNMLVCTEGGDTYTLAETEQALHDAAFEEIRLVRQGEWMDCLVEARKPGAASPSTGWRVLAFAPAIPGFFR